MDKAQTTRSCGGCTECCFTHMIRTDTGLFKDMFTDCMHCTSGVGCMVYDSGRPDGCKTMSCAWLRGVGADNDRPDKTNVVLSETHTAFGSMFAITASNADALNSPFVETLTDEYLRRGYLVAREDTTGRREAVVARGRMAKLARRRLHESVTVIIRDL